MDFIVPDCQIRKVNGRIYSAGDIIPGYTETQPEQPKPIEPIVEEAQKEKPKRRSKRDSEINDLLENISVMEANYE